MLASSKGHAGVVKLLLEQKKIVVNAKGNDKNTALMKASYGGHAGVVKLLLEQKILM